MDKELRLDKFLADMGKGTRSALKEAVRKGRVRVNGEVIKKADIKVRIPGDTVTLDGEEVAYAVMEYYMLNKPQGVVSATEDKKYPTVLDLIADKKRKDLFPVGRLDLDSEGLLLLTNDGAWAQHLLHPKHEVEKTYHVSVFGPVAGAAARLAAVTDLEGEPIRPARVEVLRQTARTALLAVTIHEGKNRQVRRMCAQCGLTVKRLRRVREGALELGDLPPGKWRYLTQDEAGALGVTP
mgnify:CR=1 FL=1